MMYWTCPKCGANLDVGERCSDCNKKDEVVTVVRNTETIDKNENIKKG